MSILEIKNSQDFDKNKCNLKLFTIVTSGHDDYKGISIDILNLSQTNPNVLFLIIEQDKCKDSIQLVKDVTSTPTFIISSNNVEIERYSGVDINKIKKLVETINNHKAIH